MFLKIPRFFRLRLFNKLENEKVQGFKGRTEIQTMSNCDNVIINLIIKK